MPEVKTKLTGASVDDFLDTLENDQVRDDCRTIARIMAKAAKAPPRMWGSNIVGFGTTKYRYANGKEAERDLLGKLGAHSCSKGCLYIKRLSDVHMPTLTKLVKSSVALARKSQPS